MELVVWKYEWCPHLLLSSIKKDREIKKSTNEGDNI
jgi:hypothetical protein